MYPGVVSPLEEGLLVKAVVLYYVPKGWKDAGRRTSAHDVDIDDGDFSATAAISHNPAGRLRPNSRYQLQPSTKIPIVFRLLLARKHANGRSHSLRTLRREPIAPPDSVDAKGLAK